jgi:hypothetical protein
LGATGLEDDSQARETYREVLQQSLGELSRSAGRRWNRQIECSGNEAQAAPPDAEFYLVEAAYPDAAPPPLMVAITGTPDDPPKEADSAGEPAKTAAPAVVDPGTHPSPQSKTSGNRGGPGAAAFRSGAAGEGPSDRRGADLNAEGG